MKLGYTLFYVDDVFKTMDFYEKSNQHKKPAAFEIGLVTKDVEAAFAAAVSAGAVAVSRPKTKPWGQVVSYVRDCNGFLVEICSPMNA